MSNLNLPYFPDFPSALKLLDGKDYEKIAYESHLELGTDYNDVRYIEFQHCGWPLVTFWEPGAIDFNPHFSRTSLYRMSRFGDFRVYSEGNDDYAIVHLPSDDAMKLSGPVWWSPRGGFSPARAQHFFDWKSRQTSLRGRNDPLGW